MIKMVAELKAVKVQKYSSGTLFVSIPSDIARKLGLKKGDVLIPVIRDNSLVYVKMERLKDVL